MRGTPERADLVLRRVLFTDSTMQNTHFIKSSSEWKDSLEDGHDVIRSENGEEDSERKNDYPANLSMWIGTVM